MVMCEDGATTYGPGKNQVIPSPSASNELQPGVPVFAEEVWERLDKSKLPQKFERVVRAMCYDYAFDRTKCLSIAQVKKAVQRLFANEEINGSEITKELRKLREQHSKCPEDLPWFRVFQHKRQNYYWIAVPPAVKLEAEKAVNLPRIPTKLLEAVGDGWHKTDKQVVSTIYGQRAFSEGQCLSAAEIFHVIFDGECTTQFEVERSLQCLQRDAEEGGTHIPWFRFFQRDRQWYYWIDRSLADIPEIITTETEERSAATEPQPDKDEIHKDIQDRSDFKNTVLISIMVHYYISGGNYWDYHLCGTVQSDTDEIPKTVNAVLDFAYKQGLLGPAGDECRYKITERGRAYVKGVLAVPLPVQTWVIPPGG